MNDANDKKTNLDKIDLGKNISFYGEALGTPKTFSKISGKELITAYVNLLPEKPGIYRMLGKVNKTNGERKTLYVGKAKNLKKRVNSYATGRVHAKRLHKLINDTMEMVFTTTQTESDALLLEANYIKKYSPPFNILLKDDKYFPYLLLAQTKGVVKITKHRGKKNLTGDYFGPFASTQSLNLAIEVIKKVFQIRSCNDNIYLNRTRPCLLHFVKKCSAPCTDKITTENYQQSVIEVKNFLTGKSTNIINILSKKMAAEAQQENYENAAILRDQISAISKLQLSSDVNNQQLGNSDIIAIYMQDGHSCIQIFFYRHGQNWGNRSFYPKHDPQEQTNEIIRSFLVQFYALHIPPKTILINSHCITDKSIENFLSHRAQAKVTISTPQKGIKKEICIQAFNNASQALTRLLSQEKYHKDRLFECQQLLTRIRPIKRIEIYDNAHISGSSAVGVFVVFEKDGFNKKQYRKYKFAKEIKSNDDYALMADMMKRRIKKIIRTAKEENISLDDASKQIDLIIIDGGIGHISTIKKLFLQQKIPLGKDGISIIGIAKSHKTVIKPKLNKTTNNIEYIKMNKVNRSSYIANEQFFDENGNKILLENHSTIVHFLQKLRDEAHRFANYQFNKSQKSKISQNPLANINNIGNKRKKALLNHFGSAKEVSNAAIKDLTKIDGISKNIATNIYNYFHNK